ncbi:uncharacterized protein DEA37_0010864, partial [Paragonimus westermani]
MGPHCLAWTTDEKDLGVWISSSLKTSLQCTVVHKRTPKILALLKRIFGRFTRQTLPSILNTYIRPTMEYAVQVWSPWLRKDIVLLQRIYHPATNEHFAHIEKPNAVEVMLPMESFKSRRPDSASPMVTDCSKTERATPTFEKEANKSHPSSGISAAIEAVEKLSFASRGAEPSSSALSEQSYAFQQYVSMVQVGNQVIDDREGSREVISVCPEKDNGTVPVSLPSSPTDVERLQSTLVSLCCQHKYQKAGYLDTPPTDLITFGRFAIPVGRWCLFLPSLRTPDGLLWPETLSQ